MNIIITNNQKKYSLDLKRAKSLAKRTLNVLRLPKNSSLSINFVGSSDMKYLNKKYFSRERATDVIALGYQETKRGRVCRDLCGRYLGDIIICPDVAICNAKSYSKSFEYEISLYIVHGILHLLGYQDIGIVKRKKMQKKQEEVLAKTWKR